MNNIDKIVERYIEEERDVGRVGPLRVFLGEDEGENIPHFHVTNKDIEIVKK